MLNPENYLYGNVIMLLTGSIIKNTPLLNRCVYQFIFVVNKYQILTWFFKLINFM